MNSWFLKIKKFISGSNGTVPTSNTMGVTDRRFLEKYQSDFQKMFASAPFSMGILDEEGYFMMTNNQLNFTLDYQLNELNGKSFYDLLINPGEEFKHFSKISELFMIEKRPFHEWRVLVKKKSHSVLTMLLRISRVEHLFGNDHLFLLQLTDITEIIATKNLLRQKNDELEKANKELDSIIYSVAHDLRAPLTSLIGLIYVMKDENQDPAIASYLDMMWNSIFRLDEFIREIVENSKNNRMNLSINQIDLQNIINEAFENHRFLKGAEKIEKRLEIDQEIPFFSDPMRLIIIFNNLISNAIHYSVSYGRDPYIIVKAFVNEKEAILTVSDNGQGIKSEHIDNIFNMFYKASERSTGSGLGLYIVKETIKKLDGSIVIHSEYGIGTTFKIILPNFVKKAATIKSGSLIA
jgi:PAS domain S-box-containing protein